VAEEAARTEATTAGEAEIGAAVGGVRAVGAGEGGDRSGTMV
jgi:hypothetical protein